MPKPPTLDTTNLLIGVDDFRGSGGQDTATMAGQLLLTLDQARVGAALGLTRHTLAGRATVYCLAVRASHDLDLSSILEDVASFVHDHRAPGCSPGIALARESAWDTPEVRQRLVDFGKRVKGGGVDAGEAATLAPEVNVTLEGFGDAGGDGVAGTTGALAAVALHVSGGDGVFLWLPDLSQVERPQIPYRQLKMLVPALDRAVDTEGNEVGLDDVIVLSPGATPILLGGMPALLLGDSTVSTPSGGFGAKPKPVTSWSLAGQDVLATR